MARRSISTRRLGEIMSSIDDGARLVMVFALNAGDRILQAGEDVTDFMKSIPISALNTHVKRGYVKVVRDIEKLATKPTPKAEATITTIATMAPNQHVEALRALGRRPKHDAFVAALKAAGVDVPNDAGYADLIDLRRTLLKDEVGE